MSEETKPPEIPPGQPDAVELQVLSEISLLKNAFYQGSGQQIALCESIVTNLLNKWNAIYHDFRDLQQENEKLKAQLNPKPPEPEKPTE